MLRLRRVAAGRYCVDFSSWLKPLSSGLLEIRSRPLKGRSSSKTKKMAVATETADIIKANVAMALCGAIRLKVRKMTISQNATTMSSGFEMEEIDSATSKVRS